MTVRIGVAAALVMVVASPALADWEPGDGHKMHYPQLPDPNGWDVYFDSAGTGLLEFSYALADDWQCSQTGLVDDVHFWISWMDDDATTIDAFIVRIYSNDANEPFSRPGDYLWGAEFLPEDFTIGPALQGDQGFMMPSQPGPDPNYPFVYHEHDHTNYYQVNIEDIDQKVAGGAFEQQVGEIYWLGIEVACGGLTDIHFPGWKTSVSPQFEDNAVYEVGDEEWYELTDPITGASLDLAFVITPEPTTLGLLMLGGLALLRRRRRT